MAAVPEELEHDLESAYRAHFPLLYRRARRWLPPDEAEDLVQETFLRAWAHHSGTNPGVPWLLTVLRNLAIDRSRKKAPVLVDDVASLETPSLEDASDNVVRLEEERRIRTAISGLTDAQQQVIRLREWGGMSQQEIANNLGTTVPSVESLLQRGRRQLRKALDHAMGLIVLPASGFWRKLRGLEAGAAGHSVPAFTATFANIATAATVIVAGAAAPLGSGGDGPQIREPAAVITADTQESARGLPILMEPKQTAAAVAGGTAEGQQGTGSSAPSQASNETGSQQPAGTSPSSTAPPSDGSTQVDPGSTGGIDDSVGSTSPPGPTPDGQAIGPGNDESPATGPGSPPPSSDESPAQTPGIEEPESPSLDGPSLNAGISTGS